MQPLKIDDIEQWVLAGGSWQLVEISPSSVLVELCTCSGEPMQRLGSEDPAVIAWVQSAPRPDWDEGE